MIFVRSKSKNGFRRAGIKFTYEGIEIDETTLTEAQITAIRNEKMLIVSNVNDVQSTDPALLEEIIEAISIVGDEKKPNVKDVEQVLEKTINAKQRDDAWNAYQERVNA